MPIIQTDIQYRLSGGAANSNPALSIGGAKSSQTMSSAADAFFDRVGSAEAEAGDVEYRCFYIHNSHTTLTMQSAVVWISSQTTSADTSIAIGIGSSAINGIEQTVANESTSPAAVAFSQPATEGAALAIGDIPPGQHRSIWVRRTVLAGAAAINDDTATIRVKCDTAA